jgi:hypothetical protein
LCKSGCKSTFLDPFYFFVHIFKFSTPKNGNAEKRFLLSAPFFQLPYERNSPRRCIGCVQHIYVLPVAQYCIPLWFPAAIESSKVKINSLFTKFLKRYLGLPYNTNNAIVHFLTNTVPLCHTLEQLVEKRYLNTRFPSLLDGVHITPPPQAPIAAYSPVSKVPSYFWLSEILTGLPVLPEPRRAIYPI